MRSIAALALTANLVTLSIGLLEKEKCIPPAWYVRVYFENPIDMKTGELQSVLFGFCSEEEAFAFRDSVDQWGVRRYGMSYVINSVGHELIRGFAVDPNVWGADGPPRVAGEIWREGDEQR